MQVVLNPQQQKAVTIENSHTLVLAGAGSGKTRTIVERVARLIEKGADPEKILLLTFTRKASNEIIHRLATSQEVAQKVRAGTFHNFCLWAMRSHPRFYGELTNSVVIDRDDQISLMRACRLQILGEKEGSKRLKNPELSLNIPKSEGLIKIFSYAQNTEMPVETYIQTFHKEEGTEFLAKVVEILRLYKQRKKDSRYLDFDDILVFFAKSLEDPVIGGYFRHRFEHILVDEMQDTNRIQWDILRKLIDPAWLYCVGDDAQSIYAFRGANIENILDFSKRLKNSTELKLTINYRSTQSILNLANFILKNSPLAYDKELTAVRPIGKKPVLKDFITPEAEAEWVAKDILKKIDQRELSLEDCMVMVRTAWGARVLEGIFIEKKIPYRFVGGFSLLSAAHVKDLLAVCRAAMSFLDAIAWVRWLNVYPGVGPKKALQISDLVAHAQDKDQVLDILRRQLKDPSPVQAFQIASIEGGKVSAKLSMLIDALEPFLMKTYDHWDVRKRDLVLLCQLSERFSSLKNFIEAYTLDPVTSSSAEEKGEKVTLITIHSAKGLEAKVCYIIQAQTGSFPHSLAQDRKEVEEERRIFYVGLTRAKDELMLTRSLANIPYYNSNRQEYFLEKLPLMRDLVDYQRVETRSWEFEDEEDDSF